MPPEPGRVLLVGAGPGPADLLTLRAARAIESAQAVLYDALISAEVLALAPAACLKIQTGKRGGRASMAQSTINRLMLRLARRGLNVVRLKGGDPSIFGRVGEETAFLNAHGIATEVVPGVTAASAAAAQFDFPLTHRGLARRLVFATGSVASGAAGFEASALADPQATLAIYMGAGAAAELSRALIGAGRAPSTPALVIESVGAPEAVARACTLAGLETAAGQCGDGPVLMVVGEVVAQAGVRGVLLPLREKVAREA